MKVLHLDVVVVAGLDEQRVHAIGKVGQHVTVEGLENRHILGNDLAGEGERDGDDGEGDVEHAGDIVWE